MPSPSVSSSPTRRKRQLGGTTSEDALGKFSKLDFLSMLFEEASYYADAVSEEDRLDAVMKAYAAATGDLYAEYYTEEEYAAMMADSSGNQVGIGVSFVETLITVAERDYWVIEIVGIFQNAPAEGSGLRVGDYIYSVKSEGAYRTVEELGSFEAVLELLRGESGTAVDFAVFRPTGVGYTSHEISIVRGSFVSESVTYTKAENDPSVGIVRISEFDMTTPRQLKAALNALLADGIEKIVFDVRNNPGGDLLSILAVLSYFLNDGDMILSSIDKEGNTVATYCAEAMTFGGSYAPCSVAQSELGMYRDLDMAVLCNGSTASAAEVFTATLRDYGLATVVGETTYGKGVMQSIIPLAEVSYGLYDGYAKMTTYAYVTKCGVTYHDIGIVPAVEVALPEEAWQYSIYTLPQALDSQLQAAIAQFN
jgi:carboxyl-terminal processing protease